MFYFFFFNDTATTEIYTLSLHDALPILANHSPTFRPLAVLLDCTVVTYSAAESDRKSTRLNSSHTVISYAVFCLKKKKTKKITKPPRNTRYTNTNSNSTRYVTH